MFGKKKRIAELEANNASLSDQLLEQIKDNGALRNQVEYLIKTIRDTDQIIFSISQCTNWESMRPRVAQLTDQMTARKVAESNRINDLISGELRSTYKPIPTALPQGQWISDTNGPKKITKD